MKVRFGTAEAIGAGVGAFAGVLALAFTGPLALGGLLVGFALGWVVGGAIGRLCAWLRRLVRGRSGTR
jgi:hypothetical protein